MGFDSELGVPIVSAWGACSPPSWVMEVNPADVS